MRIGYLAPEFPGQTHSFLWREIRALRETGVEVDIVGTRPSPAHLRPHEWCERAVRETFYLHPLTPGDVARTASTVLAAGPRAWSGVLRAMLDDSGGAIECMRRAALLAHACKLVRRAKERAWTHVHVHSCANAAMIAMLARELGGPAYSLVLHGPLAYYGAGQRAKWRRAAFGVVITRQLEAEVREQLAGALPAGGIEVAPMGVDIRHFDRRGRYEPWAGQGPLRVVSCGRLHPHKGHADLIEAISILRREGVDARLRVLGEGEDRPRLEALVARLGLADAVELPGAASEDGVRDGAEQAHVFALASLSEALGVVIMEAMAMRTPVVATGVGGVAELVEDGVDGLLVPMQRPDEVAGAIRRIARDPALARRLSDAGRRKIESNFHSGVSAAVVARRLGAVGGASAPSGTLGSVRMGAVA